MIEHCFFFLNHIHIEKFCSLCTGCDVMCISKSDFDFPIHWNGANEKKIVAIFISGCKFKLQ